MDALTLSLIVILAVIVVALAVSVQRVPDGHTYTVDRLGRLHRTLQPGLHFIVPGLDRITHRVSMGGRVLELHCESLHTKDAHCIMADGMIYFQILDPRKAAGRLNTLDEAAQSLCVTTTRDMVRQMTADSLHHRTAREINAWLLGLLNQSATQWGVRITRIDLDFSEDEENGQTHPGQTNHGQPDA